ncbi:hypothetical protein [Yoonia litorea]|uniref:Uncharacterized protein n=1 Tax=Yoonia litorea TaxID=1123755 RepID=A0A1I6LCF3_9RHOB|nr:hypothetical protein [Yoonia litorea]SFS01129.1 hypothetical protein SAMN05444714_0386 [Yoonia litorea]
MQLPLTVRLMFHGLRAAIIGALILMAGWIAFIPANSAEAAALDAAAGDGFPEGLRAMRAARIILAIAPDTAYELAARSIGPEVSGWMVRLILTQVAAGNVPQLHEQQRSSNREIAGPRFIQVD